MDVTQLEKLLTQVRRGSLSVPKAVERLRTLPYEDVGFASVDHHRALRQGFPEVIFCEGKTTAQVVGIARSLNKRNVRLLATRASAGVGRALTRVFPKAVYHPEARVVSVAPRNNQAKGNIVIVTAGTADIPVAEEARVTAEVMGSGVQTVFDVGVAGVHRLLDRQPLLNGARVIIVVAGMDGVLPSVIGGLVQCPVVAVPTSQGYGASFGGLAALLTMLNACSSGIGVMNIDNGFGAACLAHRINLLGEPEASHPG